MSFHFDSTQLTAANAGLIAAGVASSFLLYKAVSGSDRKSALEILRGPRPPSYTAGNLNEVINPTPQLLDDWLEEYGTIWKTHGIFMKEGLVLADPKALQYILSKPNLFRKPTDFTAALLQFTGPGLLTMEGDDHKRHRKIVNPAFSMGQIRHAFETSMTPKVYELKEIWTQEVQAAKSKRGEPATIDILTHMSHMAMDIIGDAGFGYQFDTMHSDANELAKAFHDIFTATTAVDPIRLLGNFIPIIGKLPLERNKVVTRSRETMHRVGKKIVADKIKELQDQGDVKDELLGKDLLSVLISSNMTEAEGQRLSDDEMIAQIATFIAGGHDTSATASTWALYALAKDHKIQEKLREEILTLDTDSPTLDEINTLTYLDWTVKEILRLHTPINKTQRSPINDEIVPLGEPITDKDGNVVNEVLIKAGTSITVSNASMLWCKKWWGPDAHEFKPERHANPPDTVQGMPSVVAHLVTFNAGTRGCIAWRFAISEIKLVLFVLLRTFVFDIDPTLIIRKRTVLSSTPSVVGDEGGVPLPLMVSFFKP